MATRVLVPVLGEAIAGARLAAWLKQAGDPVRRGDELAELETDKAVLMLECPADGVLLGVLVEAGSEVATGDLLAYVGAAGQTLPAAVAVPAPSAVSAAAPAPAAAPAVTAPPETPVRRRISPAARRMARAMNIDLATVLPAAPGKRITTRDLAPAAGSDTGARLPSHRVPLTGLQRTMAARMVESAREIPQFSVTAHADATALLAAKARLTAEGYACSLTALLAQVVARTLLRHPLLNARYDGDALIVYETVNLGVAVAAPDGLLVPVVHGAERLGLAALAQQLAELAHRARAGRLSLAQISDATFTLSNLGMFGVSQFTPLVNPPQAAILGVGAAEPAVIPAAGGTRPIRRLALTVSADHRVVDGAAVARFLNDLGTAIQAADPVV